MNDAHHVVLVTGGTGNLGAVMCAALRRAGHTVYFTSRSASKIAALEQCINAEAAGTAPPVRGIEVDLLSTDYHERLDARLKADRVRPTALVNNARSLQFLRVSDGCTARREFMGEFELGVVVPYELGLHWTFGAEASLRCIVNVASIYGMVAPNRALYADGYACSPIQYGVVKAGVIHLTKEMAVRLADRGVRVNCISYGGVEGRASPEFIARYASLTPQARMLNAGDVAGPLIFLLSASAAGVTGHNLVCDGGFTVW